MRSIRFDLLACYLGQWSGGQGLGQGFGQQQVGALSALTLFAALLSPAHAAPIGAASATATASQLNLRIILVSFAGRSVALSTEIGA
jgi:hypothetical protein